MGNKLSRMLKVNSLDQDNILFSFFPLEMILHILSFVDLTDAKNVGLFAVDRRLRRICLFTHTKLEIGRVMNKPLSILQAKVVLSHCPTLSYLVLLPGYIYLAAHALRYCPTLTFLSLSFCGTRAADGGTRRLIEAISEHGKSLTILYVEGADFRKVSPWSMSSVVRRIEFVGRKMNALNDTDAGKLDLSGLIALTSLPLLRSLSIPRCKMLTSRDFADAFGRNTELIHLDLSYSKVEDDGLKAIVKGCPYLAMLDLNYCLSLTDVGVRQVVVQCKEMRMLQLASIPTITGSVFDDVDKFMPRLEYLKLEGCFAIEAGVRLRLQSKYGSSGLH